MFNNNVLNEDASVNYAAHCSLIKLLSPPEKMISSEVLEGVPLLVLANKQDVPVLYDLSFIASM